MNCRHCKTPLSYTFVDLGFAPPSNAYLTEDDLRRPETFYPLKIKVCDECWLVQTEDYAEADALFTNEYAYFSTALCLELIRGQQKQKLKLSKFVFMNCFGLKLFGPISRKCSNIKKSL